MGYFYKWYYVELYLVYYMDGLGSKLSIICANKESLEEWERDHSYNSH